MAMRLCLRLAVLAALLVALAMGLVTLRTDIHQAGSRLHVLFREKRGLESECCRLEIEIGMLKSQERLREHAADIRYHVVDGSDEHDEAGAGGRGGSRPRLVDRHTPGSP